MMMEDEKSSNGIPKQVELRVIIAIVSGCWGRGRIDIERCSQKYQGRQGNEILVLYLPVPKGGLAFGEVSLNDLKRWKIHYANDPTVYLYQPNRAKWSSEKERDILRPQKLWACALCNSFIDIVVGVLSNGFPPL